MYDVQQNGYATKQDTTITDQYHQQRHNSAVTENLSKRSARCSSVRFSKDLEKMQTPGTYEFFFRAKQVRI